MPNEENEGFWDDYDDSHVDEYVNEQFNQNMANFDQMLLNRYKHMNSGRDKPDTPLKAILDYNPVDKLMEYFDKKLEKYKKPLPNLEPAGPLKYHYGDLHPIQLYKVYGLRLSPAKLELTYDQFMQIQGDKKAKGKTKFYSFPMKNTDKAFFHEENKKTGQLVDKDRPEYYTNLDPEWEMVPEVWDPQAPFFLEHYEMPTFEDVKNAYAATQKMETYIPEDLISAAVKKAHESEKYKDMMGQAAFSDIAYAQLRAYDEIIHGTNVEAIFDFLEEPPPYHVRRTQIEGSVLPQLLDPASGEMVDFNPDEHLDWAKYLNDLESKYWEDMIEEGGAEVSWSGRNADGFRLYRFGEGWVHDEIDGTGTPPPSAADLDYYIESKGPPIAHPQELIDPGDNLIEVVDRWDMELNTEDLAPEVQLYIGFQWAHKTGEEAQKTEEAMIALPVQSIKVTWPEKDFGKVVITFAHGITSTEFKAKICDGKEYKDNSYRKTNTPASAYTRDDIVRIAHYYNPDDPSSYDSVKMFADELHREVRQTGREWSHSFQTAATNAHNLLVDTASDKKAMCCLFISFLNANPKLKESLDWDSYSVKGTFCLDSRTNEPFFMWYTKEKCEWAAETLEKPYVWEYREYSIQELLESKRNELITWKTILEIAMEGWVSFEFAFRNFMLNIMEIMMTVIHMSLATWLDMVTQYLLQYIREKIQEYRQKLIDKVQENRLAAALWRCLPLERIIMMMIEALIGPPGLISAIKDYSARLLAKFKRFANESNTEMMALASKRERGKMYPFFKGAVEIIDWLLDLTAIGLMICGQFDFDDNITYEPDLVPEDEDNESGLGWCLLPSGQWMELSEEDCNLQGGEWHEDLPDDVGDDEITQPYGCTDPTAVNYNANALIDDGTCIYDENTGDAETDLFPCLLPDGTVELMTVAACIEAGGEPQGPSDDPDLDFTDPLDPSYYDTDPYTGQIDITDTEIDPLKLLIAEDVDEMAKFFNKYIGLNRRDAAAAASDAAAGRCTDLLSEGQVNDISTVLNTLGIKDGK